MQNGSAALSIKVLGTFRVTASDGTDLTPSSRKTCALMALLALAPDKRRTRLWVQNRLWGTRGKEQAASSLRQALADARRSLADRHGCLLADKTFLRLDSAQVVVDFDEETFGNTGAGAAQGDLLEGLEIPFEDFTGWLADQRRFLALRREKTKPEPEMAVPGPPVRGGAVRSHAFNRLVFGPLRGSDIARGAVNGLLDSIGKTVRELGAARVIDQRIGLPGLEEDVAAGGETLHLATESSGRGEQAQVRLVLSQVSTGEVVWNAVLPGSVLDSAGSSNARLLQHINEAAGAAAERFMAPAAGGIEQWSAAALCQEGIQTLFRLGRANYDMADRLFARAYDLDPRGIYLAWRAYLRTFLIAERQFTCRKSIEEEAFAYLRQALDRDPNNSYVLALGAHVHTILRRSYLSAFELADRSVAVNPSNPIGWACLGISKCHLGQSQEGFRDTQLARSIAGWSPARFQLDALSCIAGSMAGKLDEAIHMGEASHALAPGFAAPMRYLVALHLISGNYERSQDIVERLRLVEPDFSYEKLREKDYPSAGLQRSTLIRKLPLRQL